MKYQFHIVDVFTSSAFGGNQLAVVPEAAGLSAEGMQMIAREFNFSESTFVLPPTDLKNTRQVRIFSPKGEMPFAGHPNVGTACTLVMCGHIGGGESQSLVFEEGIGPVAVKVERRGKTLHGTLTISGNIEHPGGSPSNRDLATVLSLKEKDVKCSFFAGVGVPFCFVQLASREAVDRAAIDSGAWAEHLAQAWSPHVFFFTGEPVDGAEIYGRMCAPAMGIAEDPATGAACAALVGALAADPNFVGASLRLLVKQGVAMGRPSDLETTAEKSNGAVTAISVGGGTAYVASGEIEVPPSLLVSSS
ncbi:MAG TPA: PhzF family phenazine biosynthesis protein [Sphingomicrobium sp.]|nr:PhzF family phenazine biosynthesis protein [Sphingomicrobium sp.]